MLLHSLVEQAQHLDLPPQGYATRKVRWAIDLDATGRLRSPELIPLTIGDGADNSGLDMAVPAIKRSGMGTKPFVAVDTLEYVLGLAEETSGAARSAAESKRRSFSQLTSRLADGQPGTPLSAVATFLHAPDVLIPAAARAADRVAFLVDGVYVHDDPRVRASWQAEALSRKSKRTRHGRCLVCGRSGLLADTIPSPLPRGSVPSQPNELALVSMNKPAQGRDGVIGLSNTPICASCGYTSMASLTALLRSRAHRRRFESSGTVLVWWLPGGSTFDPFDMLSPPAVDDPAALLGSVRTGKVAAATGHEVFHAVLCSANVARLVVRRWIDMPLAEVHAAIERWFTDHRIASRYDGSETVFPLWQLDTATGRWDDALNRPKGPAPGCADALALAALQGSAPPVNVVTTVLARLRADRHVTDQRAALLRLSLHRNHLAPEGTTMPGLNEASTEPAYVCGRLLAELDDLQRSALKDLNVTVADRVLARASMAPGAILPKLLGDKQAHLKKLRRDNPGAARAIEQRIDRISTLLDDRFPQVLPLPQQGQFFLGFHHQKATAAARRAAAPKNTNVPDENEEPNDA